MLKLWIACVVAWSCLVAGPASAQEKSKAKANVPNPAGAITTITSFDKDHTVVGWLEIIPFESKIFHNTRMLRVLVPANYASPHNAHRSYPVLYMQDGQNLFDEATSNSGEWHVDETVEHLVGSFKIPPMFVVGIDYAGEERSFEYLPYPNPHSQQPRARDANEVHGNDYVKFLLTEVMPFIEKKYRISRGAANTGIGGSSYGGDISLYTVLRASGHLRPRARREPRAVDWRRPTDQGLREGQSSFRRRCMSASAPARRLISNRAKKSLRAWKSWSRCCVKKAWAQRDSRSWWNRTPSTMREPGRGVFRMRYSSCTGSKSKGNRGFHGEEDSNQSLAVGSWHLAIGI